MYVCICQFGQACLLPESQKMDATKNGKIVYLKQLKPMPVVKHNLPHDTKA
jgi:hypothetical protein